MRTHIRRVSHPELKIRKRSNTGVFEYDGREINFDEGDMIASALLKSGLMNFSRSYKYRRFRSLCDFRGFGVDSLVTIDGNPNCPADYVRAKSGMRVRSQTGWPSLQFDLFAINDFLVSLLPNGFYYKMFHRPRWLWPIAERVLRRFAGQGEIGGIVPRGIHHYTRSRFADVCVIGGGVAGLSAALQAAKSGAHVILLEREIELGGRFATDLSLIKDCPHENLNGIRAHVATSILADQVRSESRIEILVGAKVFGVYEDGLVAVEHNGDLLKIRTPAPLVATGACDRHLVFEGNDIPGVMTGEAVTRLIWQHQVVPGKRAVVATTHEGGYQVAKLLREVGVQVVTVLDLRNEAIEGEFSKEVRTLGIPIRMNMMVQAARGRSGLRCIDIKPIEGGPQTRLNCDLLIVAVGRTPLLSLISMGRDKPRWDEERGVFRVGDLDSGIYAAGDVNGSASFDRLCQEGIDVASAAVQGMPQSDSYRKDSDNITSPPPWCGTEGRRAFVCRCMDVTIDEVERSMIEGYDEVETLKRFTGLGMGRCQGKFCYESSARLVAQIRGKKTVSVYPTTMRPPAEPVTFGVLAGRTPHLANLGRTPMHNFHEERGAHFIDAGSWKRPYSYGNANTEAQAVRQSLGIIDVSTLGKFEIEGPDTVPFLQFVLGGRFAKLEVGRVRYHAMLSEDGILYDDGTVSHFKPDTFYLSTTTGHADSIHANLWWWVAVKKFNVVIRDRSSGIAAVNISGPDSRTFLSELMDLNFSNDVFPYMSCTEGVLEGVSVRLLRIGFTGELSYEVHFPAEYGADLWSYLLDRGRPWGIVPFGVEAQRILRLEKGHVIPGVDTDALSNPDDAGLGFTCKTDKTDFVGRAFLRHARSREREERIVTFRLGPKDPIPEDGACVFLGTKVAGRVTSARFSPTLGHGIGLAWIRLPNDAAGTRFTIKLGDGHSVEGEVLKEHAAVDPAGERLRS